jgi:hypothetical protein
MFFFPLSLSLNEASIHLWLVTEKCCGRFYVRRVLRHLVHLCVCLEMIYIHALHTLQVRGRASRLIISCAVLMILGAGVYVNYVYCVSCMICKAINAPVCLGVCQRLINTTLKCLPRRPYCVQIVPVTCLVIEEPLPPIRRNNLASCILFDDDAKSFPARVLSCTEYENRVVVQPA